MVQAEPAGFLEEHAFQRGVATLTRSELRYDLLLRADQIEGATRFVDRHTKQRSVLDHLGKPGSAEGWARALAAAACGARAA